MYLAYIFLIFKFGVSDISFDELKQEPSSFVRRLPIHLYPINYKLVLLTRLEFDHFQGLVEIEIISLSYNRHIVLHQKDIRIMRAELFTSSVVSESPSRPDTFENDIFDKLEPESVPLITVKNITYNDETETVIFTTEKDLEPNQKFFLRLRYKALYSKKLDGLYKTEYTNSAKEKITIASTQFEPTSARKVFPCFDEPQMKAVFDVTIIHDSNLFALSNMPLQDGYPKNLTQYLTLSKFQPSIRMSTYLLSLSLVDFVHSKIVTESGVTIRVFAADYNINNLQYATNVAAKMLMFCEEFFGEKYPITKLDLISMTEFMSGAMENFGNIIFRSTNLIYDQKRSPSETKRQIMMVICHELAHQWFGNLVTMKWWNDIWLNEGFANLIEYFGADFLYPKLEFLNMHILYGWSQAIEYDSINNSHSLSQSVDLHPNIEELFDPISYNKGSSILRMLESIMGKKNFIKGLRSYVNTYRYSNADTDDLWQSLEQFSNLQGQSATEKLKLKTIMSTWTNQRSFPLLQVDLHPGNVIIEQMSYLKAKVENRAKRDTIDPLELVGLWFIIRRNFWIIPIEVAQDTDRAESARVWMTERSLSFPISEYQRWVKINKGMTGYYITNYNDAGWTALIRQMKENHLALESVDRTGLIHDALKLTCDGIISPLIPLELIDYMNKEMDYLPWAMLRSKHSCFSKFLFDKHAYRAFKTYIWEKQKHLKNVSVFDQKQSNLNLDTLQQYEFFLYGLKNNFLPEEKEKLKKIYKHLINENLPGYGSPEVRTLALMFGPNQENEREFYTLWKLYIDSTNDYDKKLFLKILSSFNKPDMIKLNLQNSLNDSIVKIQDTLTFLTYILKQSLNFDIVMDFVSSNWPLFTLRYTEGSELPGFIMNVVTMTEREKDLQTILDLIQSKNYNSDLFSIRRIYEKIEEKRQNKKFKWLKSHRCITEKWLQKRQYFHPKSNHFSECQSF